MPIGRKQHEVGRLSVALSHETGRETIKRGFLSLSTPKNDE